MKRSIRDAYIKQQRDATIVTKQWPNTSSLEEKQLVRTWCKTDLSIAAIRFATVNFWTKYNFDARYCNGNVGPISDYVHCLGGFNVIKE
jgi:hypothetical protein